MKWIKRLLLFVLILLVLVNLVVYFSGNSYLYHALYYRYAGIDDHKIFSNRFVPKGPSVPIKQHTKKVKLAEDFRNYLIEKKSTAFLVLENDSICYEEYWDGYHMDSYSNSFSVAKSIVSILIGIAIDEGKIQSVSQKVSDFLPEFSQGLKSELCIKHLLSMTAGFDWDESYASLFSLTTKAYYGNDLRKLVANLEITNSPGSQFEYQSCNQLVLAMVLEKATATSLSAYASEKLWQPLGASMDAMWSLDKEGGLEKAYCCFNSNARDFSRIGSLYLHNGSLYGNRIVSENYVNASILPVMAPDKQGLPCNYYGYSWWLSQVDGISFFYARGILGQYIIVVPEKNVVIVRLGHEKPDHPSAQAADYIASQVIKTISEK